MKFATTNLTCEGEHLSIPLIPDDKQINTQFILFDLKYCQNNQHISKDHVNY